MSKGKLTMNEIYAISNKVFKTMADELNDEEGTASIGDVICVLGIMHRMAFACVEREKGIEKAREDTGFIIDLIEATMNEGAWDEVYKRMK